MTQVTQEVKSKNGNGAPVEDEFVDYVIDRPSFKPELFTKRDEKNPEKEVYTGLPVQGYWIGHGSMGNIVDQTTGEEREAFAYIVRLTAPTRVKDRSGDTIEAKKGDEIYVWENAQLKQALPPAAANHPDLCVHMKVTPLFRSPMKGQNKKLWQFKFQMAPPKARKEIGGGGSVIQQMLATATAAAALPVATTDVPIPF